MSKTPQEEAFEKRMAERRQKEDENDKLRADRLRHEYLNRTGRDRMKP